MKSRVVSQGHLPHFGIHLLVFAVSGLFFLPRRAAADSVTFGAFTLTGDTASRTITEGDSYTLDFTVTSSDTALGHFFDVGYGFQFVSGDSSDSAIPVAGSPVPILDLGTCDSGLGNGEGLVQPGGSCTFSMTFSTQSGTGETDGDQGVWLATVGLIEPGDHDLFVSFGTDVVVADPPATTPEPSSLLLFGAGLLGLGPFIRSRFRRR